jgi:ABC-type branched-subunit amino acid transport system substrate-binding protein
VIFAADFCAIAGRLQKPSAVSRGARLCALLAVAVMLFAIAGVERAHALVAQEAEARGPTVKVGIFYNSRSDRCFDNGYVDAIRYFATTQRDRVNETGGVAGRRMAVEFFDEDGDSKKTIEHIRTAIADEQLIALVGLSNSTRAKDVFEAIGGDLKSSNLPWFSNISVNSVFADYPNVFTMRGAQEDDSIPVMVQFIKDMKYKKPAFIGLQEQVFSTALRDGLKAGLGQLALVSEHLMPLKDNKLEAPEIAAMVEELKRSTPDMLFAGIGGSRMGPVLTALEAAGIKIPVFVSGRIDAIFEQGQVVYSGDLYQLAWDGLPDSYSDRMRRRMFRSNSAEFLFEGARNKAAPGWTSGECKETAPGSEPKVLSPSNLRAVSTGMQFADMLAMIAQTMNGADGSASIARLRDRLAEGVKSQYPMGRGVFPGESENWSFRILSRAAARTPFVVMRAKGFGTEQLAPIQYVGLRNDTLRQIKTLYMDIDLTRAFRINDAEKSFFAEFYLAMHAEDNSKQSIDQIEFANAFLDPQTNNKQITIRPVHPGGQSEIYPSDMKIYAVSGKFMFAPNFGNYPFDTQRFAIDIRSKSGDMPFIVQPSPSGLRDQTVLTEDWDVTEQYVGYDEDFLPVIDARSHARSIVPSYKGSFVWVMKREATDYFLTVVVPLAFIMIIAYLAIFIPRGHFEAIVTIQVTALLSAVALYITIPKVGSDQATVSDKIFLFNYMLTSLMIGISILRVNRLLSHIPRLDTVLYVMHVVGIPVIVMMMALYVIGSSMSDGQTASGFWEAIGQALWG